MIYARFIENFTIESLLLKLLAIKITYHHMDIKEIQQQALAIAQQYSQLNDVEGRKQWTATEYMQAFVGDVGDLAKLIMAKNNFRTIANHEEKLAHELGDCLWAICVIAKELNIDLESAFLNTMQTIQQKIAGQK